MKRLISLILSLSIFMTMISGLKFSVYAFEDRTGKCGDHLTYFYDGETQSLTISGYGDMYDYDTMDSGFLWDITSITIEQGVTSIGNHAFHYKPYLQSVYLPDTITRIGNYAFAECKILPNITIPYGVKKIGEYAFLWCEALEYITLPNSVKTLGDGVFCFCDSLKLAALPKGMKKIGDKFFRSCDSLKAIAIPQSVTSIGYEAFYYCTSLKEVIIPESVNSIAGDAFYGCKNIKKLQLPNKMKSIGSAAFQELENLKVFRIPSGITRMTSMIRRCGNIKKVIIPKSVKTINAGAFYKLTSLKDVYYEGSKKSWSKIKILDSLNDDLKHAIIHYNYKIKKNPKSAEKKDKENVTSGNQYLSKLLLDFNYNGVLSGKNGTKKDKNPISSYYEFYKNPSNVSQARSLVNILKSDSTIEGDIHQWQIITFDGSTENQLKQEDYYKAIILEILDEKVQTTAKELEYDKSFYKLSTGLSKTAFKSIKAWKGLNVSALNKINVKSLSKKEKRFYFQELSKAKDSKNFWELTNQDFSLLTKGLKYCETMADVVETLAKYERIAALSKETIALAGIIAKTAPSSNPALKAAAKSVYAAISKNLPKVVLTRLTADKATLKFSINELTQDIWSLLTKKIALALGGTIGGAILSGALIGQTLGKTIVNYCFSTDHVIEQYFVLKAVVNFEDVMLSVVNQCEIAYKNSETPENADMLMKSIEYLLATYRLGCEYCDSWIDIVCGEGIVNKISNALRNNDTQEAYHKVIDQQLKNFKTAEQFFLSINFYKKPLKNDYPKLYTILYGYNIKRVPKDTLTATAVSKLNGKKSGIAIQWKKVNGVTGYQVQYSLKKNFKSAKTKTVKGAKKTGLTVKKLKSQKQYYVRVRAYKTVKGKKYYSKWSKAKSVKTK